MRYVTIPADIQFLDPRTKEVLPGKPKTFIEYAYEILFNDPSGGEGGPVKMRRWQKMIDKFDKYSAPGDVVVLEDADWTRLKAVVEGGKASYGTLLMLQLLPFADAVTEALTEDPRPKTEAPAAPAKE